MGNLSLFELFRLGGWVMFPLVVCSVLSLAVVLERFLLGVRRSRVIPEGVVFRLNDLIAAARYDEAGEYCRQIDAPISRIALAALRHVGGSREDVIESAELAGRIESAGLQRYVGILGTVAAIAPLLGLFGTVVGIIRTFGLIEQHGIGNPQILAGGISEALIATASGILIAVPSVIFYRVLLQRARQLTLELECAATELLSRMR